MPVVRSFALNPLARSLKVLLLTPLLLASEHSLATTFLDGTSAKIDGSTAVDTYRLSNGATLTADGARTQAIQAVGSTLNMTSSQVQSTGSTGVSLQNGTANIAGSTVSGRTIGLVLGRPLPSTLGSTAKVTDSTISGGQIGASVSGASVLTLERTSVSGSGQMGVRLDSGTLNASSSTITGGQNGIRIGVDTDLPNASKVELRNSHVEGLGGSAIFVGAPGSGVVKADISVLDGSTLTGSNGTLMEVVNGAESHLRVGNSHLKGDILADDTSTANLTLENAASFTGRLLNVNALAINSNATWTMVGDGSVKSLVMDGGFVEFGSPTEFYKLSVGELSGNGTFVMAADFATGQVDTLEVTGKASGNHSVLMSSSGIDPTASGNIPVIHIASGDATFSLLNGPVDLGAYSYDLIKQGNNDWVLNTASRLISPGSRSVLALFNAAPTVWYGELSTLRSRMGELRLDEGKAGGWMRAYGNKFDVDTSAGVGYKQTQQGLSFGADVPLSAGNGQWLVGVLGGYSDSDLDLSRGTSGTVNSYYVGGYTTWMDGESGYYFDGVLKLNRFQNQSKVQLSDGTRTKGDYDNHGVGASLEFGRHITLDDGYFVEPFTQVSGVIVQGKDYTLDNGLRAEGSNTRSLLGKAGATVGRNFALANGGTLQPYLRAAYVHEFAKHNEVKVNDNAFNNNLSGSRGELGVGVAMSVSDSVSVHADFDYSNGNKVAQPWGANLGVRYCW
ncbi:autotransporter outer membrane beta-barrel domain-containing protein [Pseudomonas fontis]|uniref:Autotransporter outer membrane beta-barrel domain-containing protein n=1 Tax=Pseudomonas fontis TaxID=2942633 RepID=A0ABT5NU55_9PSED|nr:autotransporter outer membrane beta-barrel domain-containing protein [Pseudomonas fontis]MDD0977342.1 autotransporter outer membrane beta-barrel domain-containing protein [Pseudomonas fontis]MDD0991710.1 autotransporter outer membrane beta-barrel domain-containing protein [Pseudomonas fontis]